MTTTVRAAPPLTLRAATALVVLQTVAEAIAIGWREERTWPLKIALILALGLQIVFAIGARRFSAGSVFALFAYQIGTVVVALSSSADGWVRALLGASAVATFVLLAASLSAFPTPEIKMSRGPR